MQEPKCPMCGCTLKIIPVMVPVYLESLSTTGTTTKVLLRYDEEEQISDCPRCQGAY